MKILFRRNVWISLILLIALLSRAAFEILIRVFQVDYDIADIFLNVFRYLIFFLAFLVWVRIVIKSEYSISKLPWLLILAIEPFTGLFFFLTFGRDYRESTRYHTYNKAHVGQYLSKEPKTPFNAARYKEIDSEITDIYKTAYNMTYHHAYLNDSTATVLRNGEEFFPCLAQELQNATQFILMQFYIIRADKTGKMILDILQQKASEGVKVYVLYDALGSAGLRKKHINHLREEGIIIEAIDPVHYGFFDTRVNYRNHRKTVVIDGQVGFIGGMNIANEYWNKSKKYPSFRDTQLLLKGAVLNSLTALFFRDYYYSTGTFIDDKQFYCASPLESEGLVQIIPSGPDYKYPPIRNTYVKMINNAKKSIKIMTPYLALDHEIITSLMIAAQGGVDVAIIVPGSPDRKLIYEVTRSFYQELLEEGIKIYTYPKTFTHAKIFIMDDRLASCGTYNLDNRSARINFEATALLYKQGVNTLVKQFNEDRKQSVEIDLHKWNKRNIVQRIFEGLIGLFAPLV
jgi:cardiolipin synthase